MPTRDSDDARPTTRLTPHRTLFDWVVVAIATGLFVGTIPPRTATVAALWGIPLTWTLHQFVGWGWSAPVLLALWLLGIPICGRAMQLLGRPDPREVTYDEFSTLPLVYLGCDRLTWPILVVGFVLHRFFDIVKPLGIRRVEKLGGGLGIMADDVLAAVVSLALMRLFDLAHWFPFVAATR
jgi:phosphatidylglycerophosphatase A